MISFKTLFRYKQTGSSTQFCSQWKLYQHMYVCNINGSQHIYVNRDNQSITYTYTIKSMSHNSV